MIITRGYGKQSGGDVVGGSGGMGGSSITHTIYQDRPLPIVKIKEIEDLIKDKIISVKSITDKDYLTEE